MLASARQNVCESIDEFVLRINKLSQECDFVPVNAQQYRDDMKRDSFIYGISSNLIRQRLLKNRTLTFTEAYEKAQSLELTKINSESYSSQEKNQSSICTVKHASSLPLSGSDAGTSTADDQAVSSVRQRKAIQNFVCYFCGGGKWHPRSQCPAKNKTCDFCDKLDILLSAA